MYGSSFTWVTRRPLPSRSAPSAALARPFPMEETTPPVTNTYFVGFRLIRRAPPVTSSERAERGSRVPCLIERDYHSAGPPGTGGHAPRFSFEGFGLGGADFPASHPASHPTWGSPSGRPSVRPPQI